MKDRLTPLLEKISSKPAPRVFRPHRVVFVLEIQYFIEISTPLNNNRNPSLVAFAVTSDGHRLLVDTSNESFMIYQEELGDVDSLGITLYDLAEAED